MRGSRLLSRRARRAAVLAGVVAACVLSSAAPASAHPLGNATVNHYDGLHLYPDHIADFAVEDIAEIPTLQRKPTIDANGDNVISQAEKAAYAAKQCRSLASSVQFSVNGRSVRASVQRSEYSERPGAIQLLIGRLSCQLSAPADLTHRADVTVRDNWDGAGIGWHEITAVATDVTLHNSPFRAQSISDALLHYPNDLLSSPLDQRGGTVAVTPGAGASSYLASHGPASANVFLRSLNSLATHFNNLVGSKHLTVGIGLLAILLSLLLGAGHAFLPGHGKTIMAAYLVGRRGRRRDVVVVGATVTLTHTLGVLALGLLISVTAAFAPTAAEEYLGAASGLLVAAVGVGLLFSAIRRHRSGRVRPLVSTQDVREAVSDVAELVEIPAPEHSHPELADTLAVTRAHSGGGTAVAELAPPITVGPAYDAESDADHRGHSRGHDHGHPHDHEHGHARHDHAHHDHSPREHAPALSHRHGFGRAHSHQPPKRSELGAEERGFGRGGLVGLGIAGGLVPSPSALLVLLATIALGRTAFGVVLVLGYGVGMAVALTVAGLLLVRLRGRLDRLMQGRRVALANRLLSVLPMLTAGLVLIVGIGLTLRALSGTV